MCNFDLYWITLESSYSLKEMFIFWTIDYPVFGNLLRDVSICT